MDQKEVEEIVLQNDVVKKWLDGKSPKKIIFVKGKMVNVVIYEIEIPAFAVMTV